MMANKILQGDCLELLNDFPDNYFDLIFTSPPYVGQIDYHDQHAYAYKIFGFDRKDELEISAISKRQVKEAKEGIFH